MFLDKQQTYRIKQGHHFKLYYKPPLAVCFHLPGNCCRTLRSTPPATLTISGRCGWVNTALSGFPVVKVGVFEWVTGRVNTNGPGKFIDAPHHTYNRPRQSRGGAVPNDVTFTDERVPILMPGGPSRGSAHRLKKRDPSHGWVDSRRASKLMGINESHCLLSSGRNVTPVASSRSR